MTTQQLFLYKCQRVSVCEHISAFLEHSTITSLRQNPTTQLHFWKLSSDWSSGMDSQNWNENRRFIVSLIHHHVYDMVVDVGRRFIVKMTAVRSVRLIHLFIARGNYRRQTRALFWNQKHDTSLRRKYTENSAVPLWQLQRHKFPRSFDMNYWRMKLRVSDFVLLHYPPFQPREIPVSAKRQREREIVVILTLTYFQRHMSADISHISIKNMVSRCFSKVSEITWHIRSITCSLKRGKGQ
jgi:hypothetical protein